MITKKTPLKKITLGRDLFLLFLECPLKNFPVVEEKKIVSFLDKAKLFSMQKIDNFLNEEIKKENLKKICQTKPEEEFFIELKNKKIDKIPVIVIKKNVSTLTIAKKEFFYHFKPIKKLLKDDFKTFFDELKIAFVVYNCFFSPLYLNKEAKIILKKFSFLTKKKDDAHNECDEVELAKVAAEFLIAPLGDFEKKRQQVKINEKKTFHRLVNQEKIEFSVQKIELEESILWMVYFSPDNTFNAKSSAAL